MRPLALSRTLSRAACTALCASLLAAVAAGPPKGRLLFNNASKIAQFDLESRQELSTALSPRTQYMIGYGGGWVTELEVDKHISAAPEAHRVTLRRADASGFASVGALQGFTMSKGQVSGPVLPSPDRAHFALRTRERAGLGEPLVDHVTVLDAQSRAVLRIAGFKDPAWIDASRLVVASEGGLFALRLGAAATPQAIDLRALGAGRASVQRPSVAPDGRTIAFVSGDAVWRVGLNGEGLVQLTRPRSGQTWPAWSPDGQSLIVVRRACPGIGGASPPPELVIVSAHTPLQDIEQLPQVMGRGTVPVRSCGPVYWLH